jgi:hypothetical protein
LLGLKRSNYRYKYLPEFFIFHDFRKNLMFYGKMMNNQPNKKNEPLCRFGPGGDFVWSWEPEQPPLEHSRSGAIVELVRCIIETISALLSLELANDDTGLNHRGGLILHSKETISDEYYDSRDSVLIDTEKNPASQINTQFPGKQMLFPDFRGTGLKAWHKPKHGIRAHRRTAKKRTPVSLSGQGTLFDPNAQSARTA